MESSQIDFWRQRALMMTTDDKLRLGISVGLSTLKDAIIGHWDDTVRVRPVVVSDNAARLTLYAEALGEFAELVLRSESEGTYIGAVTLNWGAREGHRAKSCQAAFVRFVAGAIVECLTMQPAAGAAPVKEQDETGANGGQDRIIVLTDSGHGVESATGEVKLPLPGPGNVYVSMPATVLQQAAQPTPTSNAGDRQDEPTSVDLANLRQNLAEHFSIDELRTLCFDLGIEYENLPEKKDGMARELVAYCERTGKIRELVALCRKLRPNVSWEKVP